MFMDLSAELAGHLKIAMKTHRQIAARQAIPLPSGWVEIEAAMTQRATRGQAGTALDDLWDFVESRRIEPRLLTYEEVAAAMNCSSRHVKRLTSEGALRSVAVGGATRVRLCDLDAFLEALPAKKELQ